VTPVEDIAGDGRIGRPPLLLEQLGGFGRNGGLVGNPTSGAGDKGPVEDVAGMVARGYGYAAFNAFDDQVTDDDYRLFERECVRRGLDFGWWARCYTTPQMEKLAALTRRDRKRWTIFNLEVELNLGTIRFDDALEISVELRRDGIEVAWTVEGAVYQSLGSVDGHEAWRRVSDAGIVVMPQSFQNANPNWTPKRCVEYARTWGCRHVVPMLSAFAVAGGRKPVRADFDWDGPFTIFLTDNVERWGAGGW